MLEPDAGLFWSTNSVKTFKKMMIVAIGLFIFYFLPITLLLLHKSFGTSYTYKYPVNVHLLSNSHSDSACAYCSSNLLWYKPRVSYVKVLEVDTKLSAGYSWPYQHWRKLMFEQSKFYLILTYSLSVYGKTNICLGVRKQLLDISNQVLVWSKHYKFITNKIYFLTQEELTYLQNILTNVALCKRTNLRA